jgi:hypothetical protein
LQRRLLFLLQVDLGHVQHGCRSFLFLTIRHEVKHTVVVDVFGVLFDIGSERNVGEEVRKSSLERSSDGELDSLLSAPSTSLFQRERG